MSRAAAALAALAMLASCGDDLPGWSDDRVPTDADELYSLAAVWDVRLELDGAALAALEEEPREFVVGALAIGDLRLGGVGVRLKGEFSFQGLDRKPSFTIALDHTDADQTLFGLRRLTLNAMNQDRSQVHEVLAYPIFRAAGLPAPRAGFAHVSLNGEPYGLYADVESVDARFVADNFVDGEGNLYEAPWKADLVADKVDLYDQDAGRDESRRDLARLVEWVARPGVGVFFSPDTPLDTEGFLLYLAAEAVAGHWDGYRKPNNHFLYRERAAELGARGEDRWRFIPWGLDQTLEGVVPAYGGDGALVVKCMAAPDCVAAYTALGVAVVDRAEALDLAGELARATALIEEALVDDDRRRFPLEQVERHHRMVAAWLAETPIRLRRQFDCTESGAEVDRDGDGFGACRLDCDDGDPAVRPGGVEACNDRDDDCDGRIDEAVAGDATCGCDELQLDGGRFRLCRHPARWGAAQDRCAALGGVLAVPSSAGESAALAARVAAIAETGWWLGLAAAWVDDDGDGDLDRRVWSTASDGEPAYDDDGWAAGEPDDWGGENCGALAAFGDGGWADLKCAGPQPFVCRLPEAP